MSMLSDIKFFLKKFLKNPILISATAYIIYRMLTKYTKKESFAESIKIIKTKGNRHVIYDDKVQKYILIDDDLNVFSSDSKDEVLKAL